MPERFRFNGEFIAARDFCPERFPRDQPLSLSIFLSFSFGSRCSATVEILFPADNTETRPNEIAIASVNVCIIKK